MFILFGCSFPSVLCHFGTLLVNLKFGVLVLSIEFCSGVLIVSSLLTTVGKFEIWGIGIVEFVRAVS